MKNKLLEILPKLKDRKVLVVGDIMLDEHILSKVGRFSPEAPVPVADVVPVEVSVPVTSSRAVVLVVPVVSPVVAVVWLPVVSCCVVPAWLPVVWPVVSEVPAVDPVVVWPPVVPVVAWSVVSVVACVCEDI